MMKRITLSTVVIYLIMVGSAIASAEGTSHEMKRIEGTITPLVLQVNGQNRVVETHGFQLTGDSTSVKTANGRWKLSTSIQKRC